MLSTFGVALFFITQAKFLFIIGITNPTEKRTITERRNSNNKLSLRYGNIHGPHLYIKIVNPKKTSNNITGRNFKTICPFVLITSTH
jgi:hypothetical protein